MWADYRLFSYLMLGPRYNQKVEALLPEIKGKTYYGDVEKVVMLVRSGDYNRIATEYTSCFINNYPKLLCPPYESWYKEGTVYGRSAMEVMEFYSMFGLSHVKELPDHVATEFEFVAFLYKVGQNEVAEKFIVSHVLTWVPRLAEDVKKYGRTEYLTALGEALSKFMESEKSRFGLK